MREAWQETKAKNEREGTVSVEPHTDVHSTLVSLCVKHTQIQHTKTAMSLSTAPTTPGLHVATQGQTLDAKVGNMPQEDYPEPTAQLMVEFLKGVWEPGTKRSA